MKRLRPISWVVILANLAFLAWITWSLGFNDVCDMRGAPDLGIRCPPEAAASDAGGVGVVTILGLWVLADLILAIVWFVTRRGSGDPTDPPPDSAASSPSTRQE